MALGPELVTNGDFATDRSGWLQDGGVWTWNSGVAESAVNGNTNMAQALLGLINGLQYETSFDLVILSGTPNAWITVGLVAGTARSSDGTYIETFRAGAIDQIFIVHATQPGSQVSFDNVSVKQKTAFVPDVVGDTDADAQTAIETVGLVYNEGTPEYSITVPKGSVISQDPVGSTEVDYGSTVDVVISLGPPVWYWFYIFWWFSPGITGSGGDAEMPLIKQGTSDWIFVKLVDDDDFTVDKTGITSPTITLCKPGDSAFTTATGAVWDEIGNGVYSVKLTAALVDTIGENVLQVVKTDCVTVQRPFQVRAHTEKDVYDAMATASALTTHDGKLDTVDGIVDDILADTADLQANQGNWLTATDFNTVIPDAAGVAAGLHSTTDALITSEHNDTDALINGLSIPSAADIADANWDEARADHVAAGSFGETNQIGVPSASLSDYKADVSNLDAAVSTRSSSGQVSTLSGNVDDVQTTVDRIEADTQDIQTILGDGVYGLEAIKDLILDVPTVEEIDAELTTNHGTGSWQAEATIGPGADLIPITIQTILIPVPNARVWISTDSDGLNVIAGTRYTDDLGETSFLLTEDSTYYLWMKAGGYKSIFGESFVADTDGNEFTTSLAAGGTMSDLVSIREMFVKSTLRYDLVVDGEGGDWSDNGADWFINAGQRYLDMTVGRPRPYRRHQVPLAVDQCTVELQKLISIKSVQIIESGEGRTDITRNVLPPDEFRVKYPDEIADWDTGKPVAWTSNVIGLSPDLKDEESGDFAGDGVLDYDDVKFGNDYAYDGILLYPKCDQAYTLIIIAKFFNPTLVDDSDVSYWTVNFPELLVSAAGYAHERTMKNAAGMRTKLEEMEPIIQEIDNALVEREFTEISGTISTQRVIR